MKTENGLSLLEVENALRLAGRLTEANRLQKKSLDATTRLLVANARLTATEFGLSRQYAYAVEMEGAEAVRKAVR